MRAIDADALIKWLDNYYDSEKFTVGHICNMVKDMPTIEERKKGEWIVHKAPDELHCGLVECPFCKEELIAEPSEYSYCPNCGADMRGAE